MAQWRECIVCGIPFEAMDGIEKNAGFMDDRCAHLYELGIFTPPEHSAADCQLCIGNYEEI